MNYFVLCFVFPVAVRESAGNGKDESGNWKEEDLFAA